jgi:hypothetical protein
VQLSQPPREVATVAWLKEKTVLPVFDGVQKALCGIASEV